MGYTPVLTRVTCRWNPRALGWVLGAKTNIKKIWMQL